VKHLANRPVQNLTLTGVTALFPNSFIKFRSYKPNPQSRVLPENPTDAQSKINSQTSMEH